MYYQGTVCVAPPATAAGTATGTAGTAGTYPATAGTGPATAGTAPATAGTATGTSGAYCTHGPSGPPPAAACPSGWIWDASCAYSC